MHGQRKPPCLSLAQAAVKFSCAVPLYCFSGELEARDGRVCGLQVCLVLKLFIESVKWANFLSASGAGKLSF